jgi:hypothetical protein
MSERSPDTMIKRFLVAIVFLASALLAQQKKIVVTGMGVG